MHARELVHVSGYQVTDDKLVRSVIDYTAAFCRSQGRRRSLLFGDLALHAVLLDKLSADGSTDE